MRLAEKSIQLLSSSRSRLADEAKYLHIVWVRSCESRLAAHHPQLRLEPCFIEPSRHLQRRIASLALPIDANKQQPTHRAGLATRQPLNVGCRAIALHVRAEGNHLDAVRAGPVAVDGRCGGPFRRVNSKAATLERRLLHGKAMLDGLGAEARVVGVEVHHARKGRVRPGNDRLRSLQESDGKR